MENYRLIFFVPATLVMIAIFLVGSVSNLYILIKVLRKPKIFLNYPLELNICVTGVIMCFFISPTVVTERILSLTLNKHHTVLCGLCYSSARGTELTLSVNLLLLTFRRWKKIKTMDCGNTGFRKEELIYVGVAWSSGITLTMILMTLVFTQNLDANLLTNDCQTMRLQPDHSLNIINYLYLLILTTSAIIILCANLSILKFLNKPLMSPVAIVRPLPFSVCPNNLHSIITDENKTKEYTHTGEGLINSKCLEDSCISCQKSFSGCPKSLQSGQPSSLALDSCISSRNVTSPVSDNGTVHSFHDSFYTDLEMQVFSISSKSESESVSSFKYKNISDSLNSELLSQITPHQHKENIKENQKNSVVRTSTIRFDYTTAEKNKIGNLDMSSISSLQELCSPNGDETLLKSTNKENSYSSKYGECSKSVISDSDVIHTEASIGFNETVESETGVFTISHASLSPNKMSAAQTNEKSASPIGKLMTSNKRNKQKIKWNSMDYIKKISTQLNRIKKNSVGIGDPLFVKDMELRRSITSLQSNSETLVSTVNQTSIVPSPHVQFQLKCCFENGPHSFKRRQAVISDEGYQHIFPHANKNKKESTSKDDRLGNNSLHEHQNFNPRKSNFAYSNPNVNCSWNECNMNMPVAYTRRFRMKKIVFRNLMIQLIVYFVFLLPGYLESVVPYLRAQPMIQSLAYLTDSVEFVLFAINPFLYIMKNKNLMNEL